MLRTRIVLPAIAAATLAALPLAAFIYNDVAEAQAPPEIGMVLYGDAPEGSVEGQKVTAIVVANGNSTRCGSGEVVDDDGDLKYVVRVKHESATPGCGANGRNVTLYFGPADGEPGRLSTNTITWARGTKTSSVTLGAPLPTRGFALQSAKDGVAQ